VTSLRLDQGERFEQVKSTCSVEPNHQNTQLLLREEALEHARECEPHPGTSSPTNLSAPEGEVCVKVKPFSQIINSRCWLEKTLHGQLTIMVSPILINLRVKRRDDGFVMAFCGASARGALIKAGDGNHQSHHLWPLA
jgi:hypothetical protein